MQELAESVNRFLTFNEYKVLPNLGKVSHTEAVNKASKEYDKFNRTQKIVSDFDKQVKLLKGKKKQ